MNLSPVVHLMQHKEAYYSQEFYRPIYQQYVAEPNWKNHFIVRGCALAAAIQNVFETASHLFATVIWGSASLCCGFKNKNLNSIVHGSFINTLVTMYFIGESLTASLITPVFLKKNAVSE